MATINNGASGKGPEANKPNGAKLNPSHQHDGQKDYQNSNQRNPDNVRNATRNHHYRDHETLTNDAIFEEGKSNVNLELDDKDQNVDPRNTSE